MKLNETLIVVAQWFDLKIRHKQTHIWEPRIHTVHFIYKSIREQNEDFNRTANCSRIPERETAIMRSDSINAQMQRPNATFSHFYLFFKNISQTRFRIDTRTYVYAQPSRNKEDNRRMRKNWSPLPMHSRWCTSPKAAGLLLLNAASLIRLGSAYGQFRDTPAPLCTAEQVS